MISIRNMTKVYGTGETKVVALAGIDLEVAEGELVAIMGPSGSGKSTLMNMIGCLDRPSGGEYFLAGQEVGAIDDNRRAEVRNQHIGFIFQTFNLLPKLTAAQNVETPLVYRGYGVTKRRALAQQALERVGLGNRGHHRPNQLSGGQQQRVAIARAIASHPSILLGDEPTGALDSRTGQEVLALFQELNEEGRTVVLVTHDERVAAHCKRVVRLSDGLIVSDIINQERLDARAELARMAPHGGEVARPS
ncbi:MAG TPA: ABC transporter ATP-binding protein [Symbiobacteriaceae bacterium]|jgi:putative ABC transport system ATP-binding protein|nr:ABC transporter ATP-binding protein [Symbiobacteriaceae bacterium]